MPFKCFVDSEKEMHTKQNAMKLQLSASETKWNRVACTAPLTLSLDFPDSCHHHKTLPKYWKCTNKNQNNLWAEKSPTNRKIAMYKK